MRAARIIVWTATLVSAPCASAAGPTIHDVAKAAVENKEVRKSDMLGFGIINTAYRDAPRSGGVLIGFDVALKWWGDRSEIVALRPIYSTPGGEVVGSPAGSFSKSRDHQITETTRVVAKPGYAVGRITLVTGLQIHALSLTFMRIKGPALDKADLYRSSLYGSPGGSNGKTLTSNCGPIVGLYGNVSGARVIALGLLFADPPADDEEEKDEPPRPAAAPPMTAADAPVAGDVPVVAPRAAEAKTPWVAVAVGGTVVVVVGLGLMLVFNLKSSPPTPPPTARPRARPPGAPPTPTGTDDIPLVYPADADEPAATPVTPAATPSATATQTPTATAANPPPVPSPPSGVPPGQLGAIDYEGDAVAPADRNAAYGGLILGALMMAGTVVITFAPFSSLGERLLTMALVGGTGVVLFGAGFYMMLRGPKHITVYENGLRCRRGSKQETLFWVDVEAVRDFSVKLIVNGVVQHTTRTVKVRAAGGRTIEFSTGAQTNGGLPDAVLQRAYDHITPRVLQQLANGQTVDLGPLEVSAAGVGSRLATIPWSQVGDVQIHNGEVAIYEGSSSSPWKRVMLGDIDNVRLLFALLDHFGGRRAP